MENFREINSGYDLDFRLMIEDNIEIALVGDIEIDGWNWTLAVKMPEYNWLIFYYREEKIKRGFDEINISLNTIQEIKMGFHELIRQIKNHPKYRLKMIHLLDDSLKAIWNS